MEVRKLYFKYKNWRKVAKEIGFGTGALWCGIADGEKISPKARKALKSYLGIESQSDLVHLTVRIPKELAQWYRNNFTNKSHGIRKALEKYMEIGK